VPGSVAGLIALLETHGTLPRRQVMAPAIRLARDGFPVDAVFRTSVEQNAALIRRFGGRGVFLPGNRAPAVGGRFVQPVLAATLERIASEGAKGFYGGPVAAAIVAEMKRGGGIMTAADLAAYKPAWRAPLTGSYRGHNLLAMPPSSSGGITLIETLNVLETWPDPAPWGSAAALHRLASAFQRAFVDRNETLGDPDFVKPPLDRLASKAYARELRAGIDDGRATPTKAMRPPWCWRGRVLPSQPFWRGAWR
jgi:gamma-glutamyltranspeptidase/glutathione hydrolase